MTENYTVVMRDDGYTEIKMPGMTHVLEKSKADQLAGNILRATRTQVVSGWECPRCRRVNAAWMSQCPCGPVAVVQATSGWKTNGCFDWSEVSSFAASCIWAAFDFDNPPDDA